MKNKISLRITLFFGLLAAVAYGIGFAMIGEIPIMKHVTLLTGPWDDTALGSLSFDFPFGISRAWDILFIALFAGVVARLWIYYQVKDEMKLLAFAGCFFVSLLFEGLASVNFSIGYGVYCSVLAGVAFSLVFSLLGWSLYYGLAASAGFSLGLSLACSLSVSAGITFMAVLPVFAVMSLASCLMAGLIIIIVNIIIKATQLAVTQRVYDWLQGA